MRRLQLVILLSISLVFACSTSDETTTNPTPPRTIKILSLGDSYTIGQSVCETCRFPEQLKDSLILQFSSENTFNLKIIAQTGWTTTSLKTAITSESLTTDYDLVTLLIGVNNQFQGKPFTVYETEFPQLVQTAITAARGDKDKLIVLSIPDYAFTPFGQNFGNPQTTSEGINLYNTFAETYCAQQNITFLNITDISRLGLQQPELIASDGLHLSEIAYSKIVDLLIPIALDKIE